MKTEEKLIKTKKRFKNLFITNAILSVFSFIVINVIIFLPDIYEPIIYDIYSSYYESKEDFVIEEPVVEAGTELIAWGYIYNVDYDYYIEPVYSLMCLLFMFSLPTTYISFYALEDTKKELKEHHLWLMKIEYNKTVKRLRKAHKSSPKLRNVYIPKDFQIVSILYYQMKK